MQIKRPPSPTMAHPILLAISLPRVMGMLIESTGR